MKVYLSHSIRGKKGNAATHTEQKACCDIAIALGEHISMQIPSLELYIPGSNEEFVSIAYQKSYMTVDQILDVDCTIIGGCEAVIVYVPTDDELQGGRKIEHDHAIKTSTPVMVFNENEIERVVKWLVHFILRG